MENEQIVAGFNQDSDDSLEINLNLVEGVEKCLILELKGYVDTYNTSVFQKRVKRVIEQGFIKLVFDCTHLNYFSSTGIGSFTTFLKAVSPLGGDIAIFGMQPKLYEIFNLLGFSQFFAIKETRAEAMAHIKGAPKTEAKIFPCVIRCPICDQRLRAVRSGNFRCSRCKTVLTITENASVAIT